MPLVPLPRPARAARALAALAAVPLLLLLGTACSPETEPNPIASAPGVRPAERDITFTSGPDTLHGTFALPPEAGEGLPAALIVSGSGPTDRDGDNPARPDAGTNENLARVLADAGVASLRYDKFGSGDTGTASRGPDAPVDYDVFADEVAAAYAFMAEQPEVDPERLVVIGHSEGALFALRAHELAGATPPAALVLAAPPGRRYLDVLDRQVTEQVRQAEAAGSLGFTEADQMLSDTRYAIASVRDGEVPDLDPGSPLGGVLEPRTAPFLRTADAMDPVDLAREVPGDIPVLVLWGTADSQIPDTDVDRLMTGLPRAERVDLEGADHVLRMYDDAPGAPVLDAQRRFSPDVAPALVGFLEESVGL
ncbi:alpha/beta fold hydrolase [Streptomonospora sp. S1-112]|uniref:Alpha/beta fold hydrolase n=1 Tax=Streptomonospora mangrovi TaxID=2883123 RepID=A0A9X3NQN3_9ACTN|nr:alpha/beta fold hydrolase [Streptomonospora mangrovi]MDA0564995.1 alpha/beta fold hydrolase [Streptomonospora mangrovi]